MWQDYFLEDIDNVVVNILNYSDSKKFAFYGDLGAGKTTLIKRLCSEIKVVDKVVSPTFTFINEYLTKENKKVYHFDFYRIEKKEELYNIGCLDYFYSDYFCFVEWPEKIGDFLPSGFVKIYLKLNGDARKIKIIK